MFPQMEYPNEVLGVFSTEHKAHSFAKEFPACSMDDPRIFLVWVIEFALDQTLWD